MPLSRAAAFAVLTSALIGGGFAAEPTAEAAPGGRTAVQVGPAMEDPEKDSFGFAGDAHDECGLVPFFSRDAVFHRRAPATRKRTAWGSASPASTTAAPARSAEDRLRSGAGRGAEA